MPLWHEQSLDSLCERSDASGLRDTKRLTDYDRAMMEGGGERLLPLPEPSPRRGRENQTESIGSY